VLLHKADTLGGAVQLHTDVDGHSKSPAVRTVSISGWSDKARKDPYAPEPAGAATVSDWCDQPEVHDPVCMANPVAMSMQEEIDAVMRHMMCRRGTGTCGKGSKPTSTAGKSPSIFDSLGSKQEAGGGAASESGGTKGAGADGSSGSAAKGSGAGGVSQTGGTGQSSTADPHSSVPEIVGKAEAEEAAGKLNGLVDKLGDITEDLDKKGQLDPELRRTTDAMKKSGKETADNLKKLAVASGQEASKVAEKLVEEADQLGDAVFSFQTEVHPHGYKWWRFRWEYAFVEANTLNLLVFIAMLLYVLLHWLSDKVLGAGNASKLVSTSVATLYSRLFEQMIFEVSVVGCIAFIIWALEECGLFVHLVEKNPVKVGMETIGQEQMHWPTTDRHFIYTLRTINMHFFLGMLFYYLLMYHVCHGAICILEQFIKNEAPDFYERLVKDGGESQDFDKTPREVKHKADLLGKLFRNKGALGKLLTNPTTMRWVFGHFDTADDYSHLKNCVATELKSSLGDSLAKVLPVVPIYPYIAVKLERGLSTLIMIDWPVWLMVEVVLVIQALVHYYLHQAVVELLPFTIVITCTILLLQFAWTRGRVAHVTDRSKHKEMEMTADNTYEKYMLWIQQLNFFFLCFSAARLLFSSFFWKDYFTLSCVMLGLFLCLYLFFIIFGSLTVPMFIIMVSVQRTTPMDVKDMKEILQVHTDSGFSGFIRSQTTKGFRHDATTLVVV